MFDNKVKNPNNIKKNFKNWPTTVYRAMDCALKDNIYKTTKLGSGKETQNF